MVNFSSVMQIYRNEKRRERRWKICSQDAETWCCKVAPTESAEALKNAKDEGKKQDYVFWFDYIMLVPLIYEYDILNAYSSDCCDFMREI